jgi:hypothetical protein
MPGAKEKVDEILIKSAAIYTTTNLGPETPLFGPGGALESIQFVSFLVTVEQAVNSAFGARVRLMSEKAFSRKNSPYRNLESLSQWVCELIDEGAT